MKKLSVIFIVLISLIEVNAQAPHGFYTRIGGEGEDIGYSIKTTLDQQYIIAGSSSSYGTHGSTDLFVVKVDTMGFPMWQKFYGGSGNEVGKSIIQLPDSGYMIAGFTDSYGAGGFDAFIIRVDKDGNQLWQRTFGGSDWDFASDLVQAIDGGIFVVGNTFSFGNGKKDGFVIKYDMSGNLLLQKFIGGAEDDELRSIIVTNDFNLATVGYTESRGEINGDGYFAKLDLNGDTLFTKTFGGPYKDYACDLVQKSNVENNEYYIGGAKTFSVINSKTHSYMYRMSSVGDSLSDGDQFRNKDNEEFVSVTNSNQHSYLTAFARSSIVGVKSMQSEIYVAYINGYNYGVNDAGDVGMDYVYSLEATKDKGYVAVGSTDGFGSIGLDIFLVKRDSDVIKYESVVGIKENLKNIGFQVKYFNDHINFNFENNDQKKIEIINMMGSRIRELILSEEQVDISISELVSSLYIVRVKFDDGKVYSKKFYKK